MIASGVTLARQLTFAPNGDLFVTNYAGNVWLLRDDDGDGVYATSEVHPFATITGIGSNNTHLDLATGYLYTGTPGGVRRFPYVPGALTGGDGDDVVVNIPVGGAHALHTTHVYDGWLYVQSGSSGNVTHETGGLDYDVIRSLIKRFDLSKFVAGTPFQWGAGEPFTLGLRNPVGFTRNELTKKMYAVVNGMDDIIHAGVDVHQDNPGEQIVELTAGAGYGYPFCFTAQRVFVTGTTGPIFPAGTQLGHSLSLHDDAWCAANSKPPTSFIQAHSAPLDIAFFDKQPQGGLSEDYRGGAFIALHGSWDRDTATGHKVVWLPFNPDGTSTMPTSTDTDTTFPYKVVFGGGTSAGPKDGPWTLDQGGVTESPVRPAGVAISPIDGALYVASDHDGNIYRIGLKK
jgi:glucose/arabinose dehydrogenase